MDRELLYHLQGITPEEQSILDGRTTIDRELYMPGQENTVSSKKLLEAGKLVRDHLAGIDILYLPQLHQAECYCCRRLLQFAKTVFLFGFYLAYNDFF